MITKYVFPLLAVGMLGIAVTHALLIQRAEPDTPPPVPPPLPSPPPVADGSTTIWRVPRSCACELSGAAAMMTKAAAAVRSDVFSTAFVSLERSVYSETRRAMIGSS